MRVALPEFPVACSRWGEDSRRGGAAPSPYGRGFIFHRHRHWPVAHVLSSAPSACSPRAPALSARERLFGLRGSSALELSVCTTDFAWSFLCAVMRESKSVTMMEDFGGHAELLQARWAHWCLLRWRKGGESEWVETWEKNVAAAGYPFLASFFLCCVHLSLYHYL